jgi:hypothetical protein
MAIFLRVCDGVAVEEWSEPEGVTIDQCFTTDVADLFHLKGSAEIGWVWDGSKFSAPISTELSKDQLTDYAALKRFSIETGGIVVDGKSIMTDRGSQSLISGAYNYVKENPDATVKFKTSSGFVELTAPQMITIANAVAAHVQASFAAEAEVHDQINDGTIATIAAVDATSWPANN